MEAKLNIQLLEHTPNPEKIIATAAKLCYAGCSIDELFEKQTPEAVERFLTMLTDVGHLSPMEHVSFTFAVEGVSRITEQQLTRHRIASYSIQSGRYVKRDNLEYVIPPSISRNKHAREVYENHMVTCQNSYNDLVLTLCNDLAVEFFDKEGIQSYKIINMSPYQYLLTLSQYKNICSNIEKTAIEDARYLYPQGLATKIMFTMNFRTLVNFIQHRACNRAQWEIRAMAIEMVKLLQPVCPTLVKMLVPKCVNGKCPEGKLSCGKMLEVKQFFNNI